MNYVEEYTGYSSKASEQEGNYFAFVLDKPTDYDTATVELVGGTSGVVTLDANKDAVCRVTSTTQKIKVVVTKGSETKTTTYNLSGLTLAAKG